MLVLFYLILFRSRQFVHSFDVNNDGNIDKAEFVGMWSVMFG